MFRILIVEDIQSALKELQALFSEEFPDSKIDIAGTVKEGIQFIFNAALESKGPYHVAILDFKLPEDKGGNAEVDESLCLAIRSKMPSTLVAHITAYPEDNLVRNHLKKIHIEQINPKAFALSKLDSDWPNQLLVKIKAFLYGSRIEKQMNELFGEDEALDSTPQGRVERSRTRGEESITHRLAALCRDIANHWNDLDENLKRRIQDIFYVDTNSKPILISLL